MCPEAQWHTYMEEYAVWVVSQDDEGSFRLFLPVAQIQYSYLSSCSSRIYETELA